MVWLTLVCEYCGETFYRQDHQHKHGRSFCSPKCWAQVNNTSERNGKISRDTAKTRGESLRDTGYKDTYRKVDSKHEHRTVMEKKLGRKLLPSEVVHHKDNNKKNNDPDNLEVKTRAEHIKEHMTDGVLIGEIK